MTYFRVLIPFLLFVFRFGISICQSQRDDVNRDEQQARVNGSDWGADVVLT